MCQSTIHAIGKASGQQELLRFWGVKLHVDFQPCRGGVSVPQLLCCSRVNYLYCSTCPHRVGPTMLSIPADSFIIDLSYCQYSAGSSQGQSQIKVFI